MGRQSMKRTPAVASPARSNRVGLALLGGTGPLAATDWATPPKLFAVLDAEFHFTLDLSASYRGHFS